MPARYIECLNRVRRTSCPELTITSYLPGIQHRTSALSTCFQDRINLVT